MSQRRDPSWRFEGWVWLCLLVAALGCRSRRDAGEGQVGDLSPATSATSAASLVAMTTLPSAATSSTASAEVTQKLPSSGEIEAHPDEASRCPAGMALIPGGEFWIGSTDGGADEAPRYQTRLPDFCIDQTEVTTAAYRNCVDAGHCSAPHGLWTTCNFIHRDREQHPINCVDAIQAEKFCADRGAELPSEAEWEYAARGGSKYRRFPWGDASPDGHACWKSSGSCPVKTYPAAAFGLYDMSGNVWEWTADTYGPYPWAPPSGDARVYRGGGWSRRFEKWMSPTLRNWLAPEKWGSHLGFRCATLAKDAVCPFGTSDGRCKHGVLDVECPKDTHFNGARCAPPGASECPGGTSEQTGYGCVREIPAKSSLEAQARQIGEVHRIRTPELDSDCRRFQKTRLNAYRFEGGTHRARNTVEAETGCKNRDVGVAWNSACCP